MSSNSIYVASEIVNKIVSITPITTKYTPISKNKGVPKCSMIGNGRSDQTPVKKGKSRKIGKIPVKIHNDKPIGIRNPGKYLKID